MHAVIRTYSGSGADELFDLLEKRKSDVDDLMQSIDGFVSYLIVPTDSGGTTVTVCRDKAGTDESVRRAKEWVAANASHIGASAPTVSEGPVIVHLTGREANASAPASAEFATVS